MSTQISELHLPVSGSLLTDGGLETTLVFHRGIELPHFAAFVLLASPEGRRELEGYYEPYLALARRHRVGFVLDTPTWRANTDWGEKLGYSPAALRTVNQDAVTFVKDLSSRWQTPLSPCAINGVIGPRGDGYKAGDVDADAAEDYHAPQVEAFAASAVDLISAITMNTVGEAIGIARAAKAQAVPCVVSFTVETDGRLVGGESLREAVEHVDEATDGSPAYYMVNCAHPSHFDGSLAEGAGWTKRLGGIRANASTKSHAELDEAETLDIGDPLDLGRRYARLRGRFPNLRVLGGCCGTDHRHLAAICEACLPVPE
ncbi:homocysteine S-methyltransferase family protein [Antarcticirhabdus aurantiaca]|uniref:Homocysteine S-methyltransferase family protein n=1 Tax=Antarcticirhabdus aurantiaca TaxID=2606717 RepID=A0ACD4NRM9_9HYPH|nr:homocysteine S-methyltransferase family protein [Antarcticirhabdus aurantiaca]WAJ29464.1 homocysteine S-methyltransferase family protein [Jeongeuplla avenae]